MMFIGTKAGIDMTHDELVKLAKEDAARVTLLSLEKSRLDQSDLIYQARKEGFQEGIKEVREQTKIKMFRALVNQGVALDIIAAAAELPVEKVKELLNEN